MTRGDRFRNMTDEQLIEFIFDTGIDDELEFSRTKKNVLRMKI